MKILGISSSPRKSGNTVLMVEEILKGAEQEGAETELFSVSGKDLRPCDGCYSCIGKGVCHIKDDMQKLHEKMIEADGIIFGVPVYYYSMNAHAKIIMDRTFSMNTPETTLTNKVGSVVSIAGSLGVLDILKGFYFFFAVRQMLPANFVAAYATNKGDIQQREQGLKAAYGVGRQMVQLVSTNFEYPQEFRSNFFAFGTHTH